MEFSLHDHTRMMMAVNDANWTVSKMEFSLSMQPSNVATMLDNSTHWLRSAIQWKWSIAEREMYRIRVSLIGENNRKRADIRRDIDDMWKARKSTKMRQFKDTLSDVRSAYKNVVDDRNTIVHGNIEFPDVRTDLHVPDARVSTDSPTYRFYNPGDAVMVRGDNRVPQNADALREVNKKADQLLQSIYAMWIAIDPTYVIESDLAIHDATPDSIGFGPNGEKQTHVSAKFSLSDVLKHEEVSHYNCNTCGWMCKANPSQEPMCCNERMVAFTWKQCPECEIAAIDNGPACWHMRMAEYYENGGHPPDIVRFTLDLSVLRHCIDLANQAGANDLVCELKIGTTQIKIWANAGSS